MSSTRTGLSSSLPDRRNVQSSGVLEDIRRSFPELDVVDAFVVPTWFFRQSSWIADTIKSDNALYNYSIALRITGPLDQAILVRSLSEVQRRHEVLRSVFRRVNGHDVQIILPPAPIELDVVNLQRLADSERQARLSELMRESSHRPFELSNERLLRAKLFCLTDREHVLQLDTHHLVCDDWSSGILIRDLFHAYDSLASSNEDVQHDPAFRYADFIRWREQRAQADERRQRSWKTKLGSAPSFFHLQSDFPRPLRRSSKGATLQCALPVELTKAVGALCQDQKVTAFMVLLAAFQSLLHAYSGDQQVGVGTCAANRPLPKVENVIGRFANDLIVQTDYSGNPTFCEILARIRDSALAAYDYQDLPFGSILEDLFPNQPPSSTPLFQTTFILQNAPKTKPRVANLNVERMFFDTETAKYDLAVWIKTGETVDVTFEYDRDLFRRETVARIAEDYARVLETMAANPERKIADLAVSSQSAPGTMEPATNANLEQALLEIWQEILGTRSLTKNDDFFEIGGDSLRAAQLVARIQQKFGKHLPLRSLFAARTIQSQAEALLQEQHSCDQPSAAPSIQSQSVVFSDSTKTTNPKSILRRAMNRALHTLCRVAPGATTVRPFLHRMRGVRIGQAAWIGDDVYLENDYPECVEIQDGAILSVRCMVIAHTHGAGKVVIGKNAFIGAGSVIVTSGNRPLVIGEGAVIMASSLVNGSVAPFTLYGSDHSKPLARLSKAFTPDMSYEELISTIRPLSD